MTATLVFPATRPPLLKIPQTTIRQQAEHGANFLRSTLPDVDLAAELIRDEITEDATIQQQFNPFLGNLIHSVNSLFLAFPMGELNRELNISPITQHNVFRPKATPVRTLSTPIQQIGGFGDFLAIRTFSGTTFSKVKNSNQIVDIAQVSTSQVPAVDIKLQPDPFRAFLVEERGTVSTCNLAAATNAPASVFTTSEISEDGFWRLGLCSDKESFLLASTINFLHLDLRESQKGSVIHSFAKKSEIITSIEDESQDGILRLTTSKHLHCFDRRFTGRPVFSYKHNREYDRSLQSSTVFRPSGPLTLIWSHRNSLVTLYDISYTSEKVTTNSFPTCLKASAEQQLAGLAIVHRGDSDDLSLYSLSERGHIYRSDVGHQQELAHEWTKHVKVLHQASENLTADPGEMGGQLRAVEDLSPIYKQIFPDDLRPQQLEEEKNANALYDLVDNIPTFWKLSDPPVESVLTSFDVAFRAGDDPQHRSRADFLTGSRLNSHRGYRILTQDQLPLEHLGHGTVWRHDIGSSLRVFDETYASENIASMEEKLREYDMLPNPLRSFQSTQRETLAREQLAIDLTLAKNVFSSQPFISPPPADDSIETMTESLKISGEPPTVRFSFLQPLKDQEEEDTAANDQGICPIGVRLLLQDWEQGKDPELYTYIDPYRMSDDGRATKSPGPMPYFAAPAIQPREPPTVVAAAPPPIVSAALRNLPQSQPSGWNDLGEETGTQSQSLDFMSSTQIVPGPFGGRTHMKKKPPKKRMGGF